MVKTENFILRYANCWEDADVLCKNIFQQEGEKYLSICSGGENSLSLLTLNPELVLVVDVNPKQLYLLELKKTAMQYLDYEDFLAFLGYKNSDNRLKTFELLKKSLSSEAKDFWEKREKYIKEGFIFDGHLERNLRGFSKFVRPIFHNRTTCEQLMSSKSSEEQADFYEKTWNTWLWKMAFKVTFSRPILKMIAPDPDFFNYVKIDVGKYLFEKTAQHLSSKVAQENHILHYALFGHFGEHLPHFAQAQNFQKIKENLSQMRLYHGFAETPIKQYGSFDGYNLSNIFEYTTKPEFETLTEQFVNGGHEGTRYVYWNILLPRRMSDISQSLHNQLDSSQIDDFEDKGWIYFKCLVDRKKH